MDTTKMRVTSENSYCQHLAEKPEMRVASTVGYFECDGCEQPLKTGDLYFFQRQMTLCEPFFGYAGERWLYEHEFCAKLCRSCGSQKHLAIEFEPFVCRIDRKGYRVIEKNSEETPHLF